MHDHAELAMVALATAREAASLVHAGYRSRPRADEKAEHDLVTEFDLRSQELLVQRLEDALPGIPIFAEESDDGASSEAVSAEYALAVDPLDGTTNFVHGHPFWCVVVGVLAGGAPVAGAVVAPALSLSWHGWIAPGSVLAHRNAEPCEVSHTHALERALLATGFPPNRDHRPENNFDSFTTVKRRARAIRRCGSAAIDLCLVADGTYDAYWERRLHVWDVTAGSALVLAAGGAVTSLTGGAPDYTIGHVIASNGRVHVALVEALNDQA